MRVAVPWSDPADALKALETGLRELAERSAGSPWRIAWCAGAGVVGSTEAGLQREFELFAAFLDRLAYLGSAGAGPGAMFLASSVGGAYGGSKHPPFTEEHLPRPLSAYGETKMRMEAAAAAACASLGVTLLVGRVANLYGPAQDLTKPQGLVSHLCRADVTGAPVTISAPLETVRDYLFVDDCAAMIVSGLDRLEQQRPGMPVLKIMASSRGTSIADLLDEHEAALGRRPPVTLAPGDGPASDLRVRSLVWPELDALVGTPLREGIRRTHAAIAGLSHEEAGE
jgi:UDP-glucose 4-epimerase